MILTELTTTLMESSTLDVNRPISGLGNKYLTSSQSWNQTMMFYQSKYRISNPFHRLNDESRRFSLPFPYISNSLPRTNVHINQMNIPKIVCTRSSPNDGSNYIGIESLGHSGNGQPIFKNISRKESKQFTV